MTAAPLSGTAQPIPSSSIPKGLLGTALFIGSEAFVFGAMFAAYFFIRFAPETHLASWQHAFGRHLAVGEALVNTAILLASSGTAWLSQRWRVTHRGRALTVLGSTILLGMTFLAIQAKEFLDLARIEHAGPRTSSYASVFYTLTSIHALHVLIGVVLLAILWVRTWRGARTASDIAAARAITLYWHFVDAVWVTIICVIYLPGNVGRLF